MAFSAAPGPDHCTPRQLVKDSCFDTECLPSYRQRIVRIPVKFPGLCSIVLLPSITEVKTEL